MSSATILPQKSGELIASLASHVKIRDSGIKKLGDVLVDEIETGRLSVDNFSQNEVHPKHTDSHTIDWLFVVDTLNFCFWSPEGQKWEVEGHTGYFALCTAINRALKEKVDILNPKFYSTITEEQLKKILRSDTKTECPLLSERVKCLHEVGAVLLEKFEGTFKNVVRQSEHSAVTLLKLIIDNFKCFRDEVEYKGNKVAIYKRAQILIGDIWACFRNEGLGRFEDIDTITMFADYRVPQTLLYFGVFEYSTELMEKLRNNIVLQYGEEMEVEIRGCSIRAVELLKEYVNKKVIDKNINSILIDHFLWDFRRKRNADIVKKGLPFHKTFSIYY